MIKLFSRSNPYSSMLFPILILLILLLSTACTSQAQDQAQPTGEETDQGEVADSPLPPADTAPPDTQTPTPSSSATPLPTLTSTPALLADITGNTNCRTGPGIAYDLLHTYLAGNQVQLLGKSPDGFFWYTRAVSEYAPDCWLWGKYTTPIGDTKLLPEFTPPPTPTPSPDFEIAYHWVERSMMKCYFFFEINNTGSAAWESALLYAYEPVHPQDSGNFSNSFLVNGKSMTPTKDRILPGETGYFHAARLTDPSVYSQQPGVIDFYFTACTEENLGGYCVTKMWTEDGLW